MSHGRDVAIFRLPPLHTIWNNMHTLQVLSHSLIALQKVQAPYHVTLKLEEKGYQNPDEVTEPVPKVEVMKGGSC